MLKNHLCVYAVISIALLFISILLSTPSLEQTQATLNNRRILIDPGHGGEDGGTVAADGTLEKNLNLAIGLDLYDLFSVCGYAVSITRNTDVSIHDPGLASTREQKVSDMRNRLAMYNAADMVISVHQNHYSVPKYAGAQVFYSTNHTRSRPLAEAVQRTVVGQLQPENKRPIKPATDGIYLLHHTTSCAILVECGFLSNPEERDALKDENYQQRLAFAVFSGYIIGIE